MLVATDGSWAFALPKKTGSQSLSGMLAADDNGGGDGVNVAKTIGAFHDYKWEGDGRRYMVVRDPRERLASMYWWSKKEQNFNQGPGGADEWLQRFAAMLDQPRIGDMDEWLVTQGEMARVFQPDKIFRFEEGLDAVVAYLGLYVRTQCRNVTKEKNHERLAFSQTFKAIPSEICDWLDDDLLR